jgi:hypothetical protein
MANQGHLSNVSMELYLPTLSKFTQITNLEAKISYFNIKISIERLAL